MAAGVYIYFHFGFAPIAANAGTMPFEKQLARAALHNKTDAAAKDQSPVQPTEPNLLAAARAYRDSCAVCHSLPGRGKTDIAKGMFPTPPQLLTGKGVTDDPVGSTHWVVKNGIRMTGMPAFDRVFNEDQLWQLSLLLAHAHELPASVQQLLNQPDTVPVPGP